MSYLFNEAKGFANNTAVGKCKAVLLTSDGTAKNADLWIYNDAGTTAAHRVTLPANTTQIIPIRVWGISFGSGLTGAVLA